MFYMSQEDYKPATDLIGQGARGMLGVQNEEEKLASEKLAVDAIVKNADFSTTEGKSTALAAIKEVNVEAWLAFNKSLNEIQKSDQDLNSTKSKSALGKAWVTEQEPAAVKLWATKMLKDKITPEELASVETASDVTLLINQLVEDGMASGSASRLTASLKADLKQGKTDFMTLNKGQMPGGSSNQSRPLSSIQGVDRGNGTRTGTQVPPVTGAQPTISQEEYNADPRAPWAKGTIYNYKPFKPHPYETMPGGA